MNSHALPSFWKCNEELPGHAKKLANKNFVLFKANPQHPSLGFQKKGSVYTVEVGRRYRAIARERNGEYYWFWIGTHEAYNNFKFDDERFASSKELIKRDPALEDSANLPAPGVIVLEITEDLEAALAQLIAADLKQ